MPTERLIQTLLQQKLITSAQLAAARRQQDTAGGLLSSVLIEHGAIGPDQLLAALSDTYKLPVASHTAVQAIDPALAQALPTELATTHNIVPYSVEGNTLRVLTYQLISPENLEQIATGLNMDLEVILTLERYWHGAWENLYRPGPNITETKTSDAISWNDVIAQAKSATQITPLILPPKIETGSSHVVVDHDVFEQLESRDEAAAHAACEKIIQFGTTADEACRKRFPGEVAFDPLTPELQLPPLAQCSGLLRVLAARGAAAMPVVLPFLNDEDPKKRFFAVHFLATVICPDALGVLSDRLFDTEPSIRMLTGDALRHYKHVEGYEKLRESIAKRLHIPVIDTQLTAIQVLGQLRDPWAIPRLLQLLPKATDTVEIAASSALTALSGQRFGNDLPKWKKWLKTHGAEARNRWRNETGDQQDGTLTQGGFEKSPKQATPAVENSKR